jgi:methionyl-tRNA formyltransferase
MSPRIIPFVFHNAGYGCLKWLLENGEYDIPLVVTHRPYKGENVWFHLIEDFAHRERLPVVLAEDCTKGELEKLVYDANPDLIFSINYRKLISSEIFTLPPMGTYNIHDSLLPAYRGFAPSVWAMLRGETETGITIHEIIEEVDAGDILAQCRFPIYEEDTIFDLLKRISKNTESLFKEILPNIVNGTAIKTPQPENGGFFLPRRGPKDDYIDWSETAEAVHNFIRAVNYPITVSKTTLKGVEIGIRKTVLPDMSLKQENLSTGEIIKILGPGKIRVTCGHGIIDVIDIVILNQNKKNQNLNFCVGDRFT